MGLETANYINDLTITNPLPSDPKSLGDDHLRLIKTVLKECFAGFTGAILLTATDTGTAAAHVLTPVTALIGYTSGLMLLYRPVTANTGPVTVNVSGLGARPIKTLLGADPSAGDITANQPVLLMYDGTNFVIIAGSELLSKTGNQTITGNTTFVGTQTVTGDLAVSGNLTGPSMTAKGSVAGQAWAGAQDFTSATLTAATQAAGTSSTSVATCAFVVAQAFSAVLPGQTGNAGKVLVTDGANASWGSSYGGALTTSSSSNIVLTISSKKVQLISMSTTGLYVTMPDATLLPSGGELFVIKNAGANNFTIRDFIGNALVVLAPGQTSLFYLTDASAWAVGNTNFDGSAFQTYANGSAAATSIVIPASANATIATLPIDSTRVLVTYIDSVTGYFMGVVVSIVNGNSLTFGTPVSLSGTYSPSGVGIDVALLSSTKALAVWVNGSSGFVEAAVITISGTTLTKNTTATGLVVNTSPFVCSVTAVSSTAAVIASSGTTSIQFGYISVPSTTPSTSSTTSIALSGNNSLNHVSLLSPTSVLAAYVDSTSASVKAAIITISGTTISAGSGYLFSTTGIPSSIKGIAVSASKALITYTDTTYKSVCLTISGTVVTFGGAAAIGGTSGVWVGNKFVLSGSGNQYQLAYSDTAQTQLSSTYVTNAYSTVASKDAVGAVSNSKVISAFRNTSSTFLNAVVTDLLS